MVLILAEDICPDLGCYGNNSISTPNIDNFSREGVLYKNTFTTAPVCSPSRSAMMTGMYQTSIGAHNHRSHRNDNFTLPDPVQPITTLLRENGYFTAIGCGYSAKTDLNFTTEQNLFDGNDWSEREKGKSFFAQITLPVTHRKFKRDKDNPVDPEKIEIPPYYPDHSLLRRDWADYLESIQLMDNQVGEIINRLKAERLYENTAVIFMGDNGRCHLRGKQWLYEGGIHVPLIIRWPGMLKPGSIEENLISSIDISASILKIAGIEPPAYMHGKPFTGKDLRSREYIVAARDRCDETVDRIRCVRTKRFKYIRNYYPELPYLQENFYKYRQYPALTVMNILNKKGELTPEQARFMADKRPPEELYDLEKDPFELYNLAENSEYEKTLSDLRNKLENWITESNDMGTIPEDEREILYWKNEAADRKERVMGNRGLPVDVSYEDYLKWWEKELAD